MNQSSTTDSHKLLIPILHIQLQKSEILFNNKQHLKPYKSISGQYKFGIDNKDKKFY